MNRKRLKSIQNLNKKSILLFAVFVALLNAGFQLYNYIQLDTRTLTKAEAYASRGTNEIVNNIDSLLNNIKNLTLESVSEIESWRYFKSSKITRWCKRKAKESPNIHGVSIALEPLVYSPKDSLFCVYYDKNLNKSLRIDTIYNYTDTALANAKWYTEVQRTKKPYWTKPYFGAGAKILIADYSVPLFKGEVFIGSITYTMSINNLMSKMYEFSIGKSGYAALINKDGVIITHPDLELVLTHNLNTIINNDVLTARILENSQGFIRSYKDQHGANKSCSYKKSSNQAWKVLCIYSEDSLFENNQLIKVALIRLAISSSILLVLILLFFLLPKGVTGRERWFYSSTVSVILIANIGFIWYLNLELQDLHSDEHAVVIKDESSLIDFLRTENIKRISLGFEPLIEIPTGIIIEKVKFEDTYNVGLSGRVWQKYPYNVKVEPGLHFPQLSPFAESNYLEKISVEKKDGYTLVKWGFRSTFMFPFDYRKFPFNVKNIQLKLTHPQYSKNILFTPDIEGYSSILPNDLPGITIENGYGSNYLASNFSIEKHSVPGDLDSESIRETHSIPMLQYEITTQKPFMNALIKQFIPIFLVSLMIFLLLFNVRIKEGNKRSTVGIETISGFMFILVLSHIDFRKTIFSSTITYLETFYFVIYFMIGFIAINIVLFNLNKELFMNRNNNTILKLLYWPFFFFSIFVITLIVFT